MLSFLAQAVSSMLNGEGSSVNQDLSFKPASNRLLNPALPEDFLLLCTLARNLHRGNDSRPELPVELILQIFSFISMNQPRVIQVEPDTSIHVASNGPEMRRSWFHTRPLTASIIKRGQSIQLQTNSHDQGFSTDPDNASWTWFDIVILDNGLEVKRKRANPEHLCIYQSHHNPPASFTWTECTGIELDPEHEIWTELEEGDCLGVEAAAIYPGWHCYARSATLRITAGYEPICITPLGPAPNEPEEV